MKSDYGRLSIRGYIIYGADGKTIDTATPIKPSQWGGMFTTSTVVTSKGQSEAYINLVVVYEDDTTEFLDGWTHKTKDAFLVHIANHSEPARDHGNALTPAERFGFYAGHSENSLVALNGRVIRACRVFGAIPAAEPKRAACGVYVKGLQPSVGKSAGVFPILFR